MPHKYYQVYTMFINMHKACKAIYLKATLDSDLGQGEGHPLSCNPVLIKSDTIQIQIAS